MVTELVSLRIAFHPDDGGEQTTVAREFVIDARHHDDVLTLFRRLCETMPWDHTVDPVGQLGIFDESNDRLGGGEKEEGE